MERKTNADLIREEVKVVGYNHTNKWWKKYLEDKYKRCVTIQQIAAVLGRYQDRIRSESKELHSHARRFLLSCANDVDLAKRILMEFKI